MINVQDNTRNQKLRICQRVRARAQSRRPIEEAMNLQYFQPMTLKQLKEADFRITFNVMQALRDVIDAA